MWICRQLEGILSRCTYLSFQTVAGAILSTTRRIDLAVAMVCSHKRMCELSLEWSYA